MKSGKYKHYKGTYYEVLNSALHTETGDKMVVYRALYPCPELFDEYGEDPLFVRPHKMFLEDVVYNGIQQPRFQYVGK